MREPSMPGITCPAIDDVQEGITNAQSRIDEAADFLNGLVRDLESLRDANSQLRQCAEYWEEKARELETANDDQAGEICNLRDEVNELKAEIRSLEREAA